MRPRPPPHAQNPADPRVFDACRTTAKMVTVQSSGPTGCTGWAGLAPPGASLGSRLKGQRLSRFTRARPGGYPGSPSAYHQVRRVVDRGCYTTQIDHTPFRGVGSTSPRGCHRRRAPGGRRGRRGTRGAWAACRRPAPAARGPRRGGPASGGRLLAAGAGDAAGVAYRPGDSRAGSRSVHGPGRSRCYRSVFLAAGVTYRSTPSPESGRRPLGFRAGGVLRGCRSGTVAGCRSIRRFPGCSTRLQSPGPDV